MRSGFRSTINWLIEYVLTSGEVGDTKVHQTLQHSEITSMPPRPQYTPDETTLLDRIVLKSIDKRSNWRDIGNGKLTFAPRQLAIEPSSPMPRTLTEAVWQRLVQFATAKKMPLTHITYSIKPQLELTVDSSILELYRLERERALQSGLC